MKTIFKILAFFIVSVSLAQTPINVQKVSGTNALAAPLDLSAQTVTYSPSLATTTVAANASNLTTGTLSAARLPQTATIATLFTTTLAGNVATFSGNVFGLGFFGSGAGLTSLSAAALPFATTLSPGVFIVGNGLTMSSGVLSATATGSGSVTSVTATAPLASSGGSTPSISFTGSLSTASISGLAPVATTGSYSSLTGQPTLLSQFTNDSGFVTASALVPYATTTVAANASNLTTGTVSSGLLPIASSSVTGGVKVGTGLTISAGVLSATNTSTGSGGITSISLSAPATLNVSSGSITTSGQLVLVNPANVLQSTDYTITSANYKVYFTGSVSSTFTLSNAASNDRQPIRIVDTGTATLTISGAGVGNIWSYAAGQTTITITPGYSVDLTAVNGTWKVE